jgi:CHASE2 domain-containing sensor protein/signal transduction histidine kinase
LVVEWYVLLFISTVLVCGLLLTGATTRLDNAIYDVALRLRDRPASANIVIVSIDFPSIAAQGPLPWPRNLQATLLHHIARDHPKAIVCNEVFEFKGHPTDDKKLRDAMSMAPVFLPEVLEPAGNGHAASLTLPTPTIASAAAGLGGAKARPDIDGIVRRTYLFENFQGKLLPNLMVLVAGQSQERLEAITGQGRESTTASANAATLGHRDEILIPFSGPPGHFSRVSASDVVNGVTPPGFFKNKYVLVGATSPGLLDNYPTPVSGAEGMPSVEIEATLLDALLHQRLIREIPLAGVLALSLGVVWVLFFGFLQLKPGQLGIQGLTGSFLFLACAIVSPIFLGLWFPPTPVMITRTIMEMIWSSRRLQAASDYLAGELTELQTRVGGGALVTKPRGLRLPMGDSVSRQMMLIDETRRRVRELRRFVTDVLAGFPDPVMVVSRRGRIIVVNQAAMILGQRLNQSTEPGAQIQPILSDLEIAAGNKDKLWPPPDNPGEIVAPRGVGPGGRILEARYTATGYDEDQAKGWTIHLVDVTALVSAIRQREGALQLFTHDMRSPQSAILAALEHRDFQGAPAALRASIEKNALRTLSLADGFVRLAQAEGSEYVFEPIDLLHLLGDAADALWPIAQSASVEIVIKDPGREFVINADRGLLARAFINLLDNAIKFSPPGKPVTCTLKEATLHDRPAVSCTIIDQGMGMSQEQQKSLFTRFARPPMTSIDGDRRARRSDGVGLGLAVVHTVVTRHDGTVACRSEVGEGTAFNIILPLSPADAHEETGETADA